MRIEETAVDPDALDHKRWFRVGSFAAVALGIGYIIIIALYARVGAPPSSGGEAWFRYLAGKTAIWWAILGLSVFTDLLYLPLALALYLALKRINRNLMLLATAFIGLFVVLDLAVTWTHYASILALYGRYSAATGDAQRAAYLAAADYASAMLASRLEVVYAIVTLSFGILLTALVMRRGSFDQITAWLGLVTGVLGIASLTGSSLAIIGNALFATLWLFFVGYRLYRLAR
ncbi:MAG: hypothetical protein JO300_06070 [Silvibacterium sp.]|nr:hypothetical protein [Silvibacterium sp.]